MFIVQRKDDLLERGTNISSSSQLSQSPFQKTFFMSSQLQSLSKDNQNRSRSLLDMEDTQSMKSMALTSLNFSTVAVSQQNDNQNAINLRNNQTIDYPNYSVKNQQNPNITSSIDKNRISLQSIPEFKQQKQQQSKTPQQNSVNKIGRNNANVFGGNKTQNFIHQVKRENQQNIQNISEFLSKQDMANRTFYTEKDSVKSTTHNDPKPDSRQSNNQLIRKGPTSLRNLSQQNDGDSRNRNSRSTLIANKSLNVQKSGTGLTRYRNTKFINESRQDALRYRNNLNHSVELETIQGINHNETVISPQTIANNSSTQLNNSTALEAYKSVPLALLPKRKKPYEEEESVNESEGYQSNHFTSINQKIDDSLEQDDKKIVFQLKRGIVGNNTNLKNRFKKLTLSLRKSQNQGIINNLANPYQNVTNANPLNNSSII
eukprot:403345899